uniref:MULE transposase domain-containing protein n=1 Tax=Lactuca sativa TaxID=4236 RepID=A0A9R1VFU4_LACSA|nr:hypothetical protein LSAT_V11C500262660 [Lactuca sativa]
MLEKKYQVGLSDMKVHRVKTKALESIKGDFVAQNSCLRDYLQEVQTRNPNTTVKLQVQSEPCYASKSRVFEWVYICLGPLKSGFAARKRDLLGPDGAFMKGPYHGMILTAVGLNENNYTYPLACVIVEEEKFNSWAWFLTNLGDDLGLYANSNFTFISDRQKGLLHALEKLFPTAEHRYCLRHLHENMKRRAHCDVLLNNMCENLNNKIVKSRDKPIISCLEIIREYIMRKIVMVQNEIDKANGPLTPTATKALQKKLKKMTCKGQSQTGNGTRQGTTWNTTGQGVEGCNAGVNKSAREYTSQGATGSSGGVKKELGRREKAPYFENL